MCGNLQAFDRIFQIPVGKVAAYPVPVTAEKGNANGRKDEEYENTQKQCITGN